MGADAASRTGGEWVVAALGAEGVRHVFGIPGVHNLAIYDALLRQDRIPTSSRVTSRAPASWPTATPARRGGRASSW